jgi:hypothetical protein
MKFNWGGLHEKHVVATWNLGTISAFAYRQTQGDQEKGKPDFILQTLKALALLSLPPHNFELRHIVNTVLNSK